METILYISLAIPLIIGFVLIIVKLKEDTAKKTEMNKINEKNTISFTEDTIRKDKLKIPGYYEDFLTSDKEEDIKGHIASVNRFMNGGTWV